MGYLSNNNNSNNNNGNGNGNGIIGNSLNNIGRPVVTRSNSNDFSDDGLESVLVWVAEIGGLVHGYLIFEPRLLWQSSFFQFGCVLSDFENLHFNYSSVFQNSLSNCMKQ